MSKIIDDNLKINEECNNIIKNIKEHLEINNYWKEDLEYTFEINNSYDIGKLIIKKKMKTMNGKYQIKIIKLKVIIIINV